MRSIANFLGALPHRVNSFFNGQAFEEAVNKILKAAHEISSKEEIIARVVKEHAKFFARRVRSLTARRDKLLRRAAECRAEAAKLTDELRNGSIPEYSARVGLPQSLFLRSVFFALVILALLLSIIEGLNFAWFLRFQADSIPFAILWSTPVFVFPVVEAVLLHNRRVTPRARSTVMLVQGAIATGAAAAYVYYSLVFADSSLVAAFTETAQGPSTEQLRMAFQILTSILFAGICLLGADALMISKPILNRQYQNAHADAKGKNREADDHETSAETCEGELEKIDARKEAAILRCYQKLDELKVLHAEHDASINQILSE